jgi:hypothetical protein
MTDSHTVGSSARETRQEQPFRYTVKSSQGNHLTLSSKQFCGINVMTDSYPRVQSSYFAIPRYRPEKPDTALKNNLFLTYRNGLSQDYS